ncbi:MAG: RDD family protein [Planctomycetes bacterium]|nr:RDD family protein [Planctomycetota bacterium]
MIIDTISRIDCPEGIFLRLRLAGAYCRASAYFLDFLFRTALIIGLSIFFSFFGAFGTGVLLISMFLLEWFYPVYFEVYRAGQSPGKKKMGIRVTMEDGSPIGFQASLLRNLIRVVDLYFLTWVFILFSSKMMRLGDMAAGTVVIYDSGKARIKRTTGKDAKHPSITLNEKEQRATVSFATRSLTQSRKQELAEILEPIHKLKGEDAVNEVMAYARHIGGSS